MHLELDDEVKKWIRSKGNQLTVQMLEVRGCCAPDIQDLVVLPVKPKNTQHFREFNIDNLTIYVHKHISLKEKLILKLRGFGIFKTVSAKAV